MPFVVKCLVVIDDIIYRSLSPVGKIRTIVPTWIVIIICYVVLMTKTNLWGEGVNSVHESLVFVVGTRINVSYASGDIILLIYIYIYISVCMSGLMEIDM